jgi:hypothetical protein
VLLLFFREGGSERKIYDACTPAPALACYATLCMVFRYHDDGDAGEDEGKYEDGSV